MTDRKQVLKGITDDGERLFLSKMCDLCDRAERSGRVMFSRFLTPHERYMVSSRFLPFCRVEFFGGFDSADRVMASFVPDGCEAEPYPMGAVIITPMNKKRYSHRDYLGSVMNLGIVRELTGDIVITDTCAYLVVSCEIADFVMQNLCRVASTSVKTEYTGDVSFLEGERTFCTESSTVSSMRLDCVLSAAFGRSRSQTASFVSDGCTSVNYETVKNTSRTVKDGDVISVRGLGKVIVSCNGALTRKGRIHIEFKKYV